MNVDFVVLVEVNVGVMVVLFSIGLLLVGVELVVFVLVGD